MARMKAGERTLQQLLHSGDQYVIPVFQRYYTWGVDDWGRLWEDLEPLFDDATEKRRHFMGSIVCVGEQHQPGNVPAYQVIDGQQRLTTLSILLCALRDLAKGAGETDLALEVAESYLVHKFKKDREHYKIYPRQRDRGAYLTLVDEGAVVGGSQVGEAYRYFFGLLAAHGHGASGSKLRTVFSAITNRLDFVAITLNGENPYKIFRSLNSTGVELEEGDLIRNHVFMALQIEKQDRFDDDHWRPLEAHFEREGKLNGKAFTAFLRDVLLKEGRYIGQNATYETFEHAHPLSTIKPLALLPELAKQAELYDMIEGRREHKSASVAAALDALRALNVSTAHPLVLWLLSAHAAGTLNEDALVRCIRALSSFVLRRYVCSESSRAYSRWFCVVCKELGSDPEAALRAYFESKGWPDDARFAEGFLKLDLYQSKYCRAVLDGIELSQQRESERVALDKCSVEHVLPQTIEDDADGDAWRAALGDDWQRLHAALVHTPGNLTLVGHDYNSSMSNRAFATKKPVLGSSKVYLNKYFAADDLETWTGHQIVIRGQRLAELATKIWPK